MIALGRPRGGRRRFKAINEASRAKPGAPRPLRRVRPGGRRGRGQEYPGPYDENDFTAGLEPEDFVSMMLGLPRGRAGTTTPGGWGCSRRGCSRCSSCCPRSSSSAWRSSRRCERLGAGPAFKLRKEAPYTLRRTTAGAQTPFYVTPEFEREILRDLVLHRVEAAVEGSASAPPPTVSASARLGSGCSTRAASPGTRARRGGGRGAVPTHTPSCAKYDGSEAKTAAPPPRVPPTTPAAAAVSGARVRGAICELCSTLSHTYTCLRLSFLIWPHSAMILPTSGRRPHRLHSPQDVEVRWSFMQPKTTWTPSGHRPCRW